MQVHGKDGGKRHRFASSLELAFITGHKRCMYAIHSYAMSAWMSAVLNLCSYGAGSQSPVGSSVGHPGSIVTHKSPSLDPVYFIGHKTVMKGALDRWLRRPSWFSIRRKGGTADAAHAHTRSQRYCNACMLYFIYCIEPVFNCIYPCTVPSCPHSHSTQKRPVAALAPRGRRVWSRGSHP